MKKIYALLITIILLLTACRPNPEKEVVVGKGEAQMDAMLEAAGTELPTEAMREMKLEYDAPDNLKYALDNEIEGVRTLVRVDADIIIPENPLPILTVKPVDISYDIVGGLLGAVQDGRLLYDRDMCAPVDFKGDVQKRIDRYEWELSLVDKTNDDSASFYKEKLKELYIELEKAPSTIEEANRMLASGEIVTNIASGSGLIDPEKAEIIHLAEIKPFELTKDNYNDKLYRISLGVCTDNTSSLLLNSRYDSERIQQIEYRTYGETLLRVKDDEKAMEGFWFTAEDARETSRPIADIFGGDLVLTDVAEVTGKILLGNDEYLPYGYNLIYTRNYNGVPSNYAVAFNQYIEKADSYNKEYPQEYLSVIVGENGICSIEYTSPHEVVETQTLNAQIMPFCEIKEIFDRYIVLTSNTYDTYINIYEIRLGLMRIAKPNSEEFLIVPVWDFYGYSIGATGTVSYTDEEYWDMISYNPNYSFLTINAIDGSIIDRELGC